MGSIYIMRYTHTHRNIVLTAVASIILITASYAVFGWSDPAGAPPDASIAVPVDTGSSNQIKTGGLTVKSLIAEENASVKGNLGIGVTDSVKKLDVAGEIHATGDVCTDSSGGKCLSSLASSTHPSSLQAADGTPDKAVYVDNDGNVGIGTNVPSQPLEIAGTSPRILLNRASDNSGGANVWISKSRGSISIPTAVLDGDSLGSLGFLAYDGVTPVVPRAYIQGRVSGTVTSGSVPTDLVFVADDNSTVTEKMIIKSTGNVGIGTTNPQSTLHVPDGKYLQAEDNNAGAPPSADCDADAERGRISIDTTNNRLYICNGATRGWDYAALTD